MPYQAWVVSLTPFDVQGRLDEAAFRAHLRRMVEAGACAYVGSSNVGEGFTFTPEERDRVFAIAVEECKGKIPLRAAGFEPQSIQAAVAYLKAAERAGLDAAHIFQLDNGHTGNPNPAEMELFYTRVIESASIPVVLSSYPGLGYTLPIDMLSRLLERFPRQIVALRNAGTEPVYLRELIAVSKGRASVYTTGVPYLMNALMHGSTGFLGGEANIAPALAVSVVRAFAQGDYASARSHYEHLYRLHRLVNKFGGSSGRGIKPLLARLGLPGGKLRAPRLAISDGEVDAMLKAYVELNLPLAPKAKS